MMPYKHSESNDLSATYKIIKTEFVHGQTFQDLASLKLQLADYVNWFNKHRIHSSLRYLTPCEFKSNNCITLLTP